MTYRSFALLSLLFGPLGGCSRSSDAPAVTLPSFQDVSSAPAPIQRAADAVVRIATAGEEATGSFISSTGLLLTNNHVLGTTVCPVEGCSIALLFGDQHGKPVPQSQTVFAVPVAVDVGLDMAVVQVYGSAYDTSGGELSTPSYVSIKSMSIAALQGAHVTIVGHPEGHLKKWTSGTVVDSSGDWFESTAYILPGNSGSPVLDDAGELVGIVHRAPTGEDIIASDTVDVWSLGTPSALLVQAMSGGSLPSVMVSLTAPTTADQAVTNDRIYLNGRAANVTVNGAPTSVLSLLGQACDAALAAAPYASPDLLDTALTPCYEAMLWIECRSDATPVPYGVACPSGTDATAWSGRFASVNQAWVTMNGQVDLDTVSFAVAALSSTKAGGVAAGASTLYAAATAANMPLDFPLANYLAAFDTGTYENDDVVSYVTGYAKVSGYALQAGTIASAAVWLADNQLVDGTQALGVVKALKTDPSVDVGDELYVDEILYQSGVDP